MSIQTHHGRPQGCAWVNRVLILARTATLQTGSGNYEALNKCKSCENVYVEFILHMQDKGKFTKPEVPRCTLLVRQPQPPFLLVPDHVIALPSSLHPTDPHPLISALSPKLT